MELILKNGKKLVLENNKNSLKAKLYTEDGVYMGEINWLSDALVDLLFTE